MPPICRDICCAMGLLTLMRAELMRPPAGFARELSYKQRVIRRGTCYFRTNAARRRSHFSTPVEIDGRFYSYFDIQMRRCQQYRHFTRQRLMPASSRPIFKTASAAARAQRARTAIRARCASREFCTGALPATPAELLFSAQLRSQKHSFDARRYF